VGGRATRRGRGSVRGGGRGIRARGGHRRPAPSSRRPRPPRPLTHSPWPGGWGGGVNMRGGGVARSGASPGAGVPRAGAAVRGRRRLWRASEGGLRRRGARGSRRESAASTGRGGLRGTPRQPCREGKAAPRLVGGKMPIEDRGGGIAYGCCGRAEGGASRKNGRGCNKTPGLSRRDHPDRAHRPAIPAPSTREGRTPGGGMDAPLHRWSDAVSPRGGTRLIYEPVHAPWACTGGHTGAERRESVGGGPGTSNRRGKAERLTCRRLRVGSRAISR